MALGLDSSLTSETMSINLIIVSARVLFIPSMYSNLMLNEDISTAHLLTLELKSRVGDHYEE